MLKRIPSYIGLFFIYALSLLPLPVLYVFATILYWMLYYITGYRRAVVSTNLRNSFPEKSVVEIRLIEKGYLDDEKFTRFWIENRNQTKGSSLRKLTNELRIKGVESSIIDHVMSESSRNDGEEIKKIIAKKQSKYPDQQKLIAYLARQGFAYDEIKTALADEG